MKKFISLLLAFIFGAIVAFHLLSFLRPSTCVKETTYYSACDVAPALKIYYNSVLTNSVIIVDNEYVKISIVKCLVKDMWWEFGYELKIINKTNKVLTITIDDVSIMNTQCKPLFHIDHIDAHNTAYFIMAWDKDTLERCHIPYIDNIKFMIRVFDNDNWTGPALAGEKILIKNS